MKKKVYIFNINRFLINYYRCVKKSKKRKLLATQSACEPYSWQRKCHGKECEFDISGVLKIDCDYAIFKILPEWCEVREVEE